MATLLWNPYANYSRSQADPDPNKLPPYYPYGGNITVNNQPERLGSYKISWDPNDRDPFLNNFTYKYAATPQTFWSPYANAPKNPMYDESLSPDQNYWAYYSSLADNDPKKEVIDITETAWYQSQPHGGIFVLTPDDAKRDAAFNDVYENLSKRRGVGKTKSRDFETGEYLMDTAFNWRQNVYDKYDLGHREWATPPPINSLIPSTPNYTGNFQPPSIVAPAPLGDLVSPTSVRGRIARAGRSLDNAGQKMKDAYGSLTDTQKLAFGTETAAGIANLAVDAGSIASQKLGLGKPSPVFYEEGVNPVYRTGDYYNRAFYAKPMGATGAEVASTGLKAAATGSKLGMMLGGPAGAAVGAAAGAVVGAGTALVAGGARKRRQEREKQRALKLARGQQADYNRRALDFSQQQTAMNEYRRRNDPYERMSNFYTA